MPNAFHIIGVISWIIRRRDISAAVPYDFIAGCYMKRTNENFFHTLNKISLAMHVTIFSASDSQNVINMANWES